MNYPTSVSFQHQKQSSRLWAILTIIPIKMILLIPHFLALMAVGFLAGVVGIIGVFAVLIQGEFPKSFENWIIGVVRWAWRMNSYFYCMTDKYPPFSMQKGGYPADLDFEHQKKSSRLMALLTLISIKGLLLIPHFFVMLVYSLVAAFCELIGMWVVLFKGEYPKSWENIIVGYMHYSFRVMTYYACLTDKYPPISWKE